MTQTWAIFLESYRNLNSKKLFWLVLILSGLVVAAFACIGINEKGVKLAFWQIDSQGLNTKNMPPDQFYKTMYVQIGISIWLSWVATILAVISTSGIFPDLMTSGSIDLLISKPISRLRLFLTEYAGGLLFVALQVTVFSAASFLVIGLRGGVWEPGLFLAVPLVVCFFSYLFSVCVLVGVLTRSTVAALLLTFLFWFAVWAIGTTETTLLMFQTMNKEGVNFAAVQAEQADNKPAPQDTQDNPKNAHPDDQIKPAKKDDSKGSQTLEIAHRIAYAVKSVLPKTTDTIGLLERSLISLAGLEKQPPGGPQTQRMQTATKEFAEILRSRSIAWVIGTSLGFEAVMLCLAGWIFCRRDY
jgi:ABC-type transport system involved in multi-copper enzyme maturation permease subunit